MTRAHQPYSSSPVVLLRISDGSALIHRAFSDFGQAVHSAEEYAMAGCWVVMISATGRFLMHFAPAWQKIAV